jgi:signal transduction histidine kinase
MRLTSELSAQPLRLSSGERIAASSILRARVPATTVQRLAAVAIVPMVAVTVALVVASDHLKWPAAAALYWGYQIAATMGIGIFWWIRRPASRFGPLLVGFAVGFWVVTWQASDVPLLFDIGVLAEGPFFVLTFYLFLAFPMGRVEPPAARWLIGALWFVIFAFFLPALLLRPAIAGSGPLTRCVPACPDNVLQVASSPTLADWALKAEQYSALAILVAVFAVYLRRLSKASRPQRRALMAVAVTSLLFLPAFFVSNFSAWVLKLDPVILDKLGWGVVVARVLLPLGFLIALLQAEFSAGRASRILLERLVGRPTPQQWRDTIAEALDDPPLRLGYHDPESGRYLEAGGEPLEPPAPHEAREWVPIERGGHPVSAMVIDETLTEDPELVRAAASATVLAVENGALEGELRDSLARIVEAGDAERRRMQRDLHDSAQQRLLALRIRLALVREQLDRSQERAMLDRIDVEVEHAIDDLRDLSDGSYAKRLADIGLGRALKEIAGRAAIAVDVQVDGLTRHADAIETTIYFCCVECLQNAAKHAGAGASVTIRVRERAGSVSFSVEDDGGGFDPATVPRGAGLVNLADRVAAVQGTLRIDSGAGRGTRITGELPVQPRFPSFG